MRSPRSGQLALLDDHLLAHQFIHHYGRRPSADELDRFRRACAAGPRPHQTLRLTLARLISHL